MVISYFENIKKEFSEIIKSFRQAIVIVTAYVQHDGSAKKHPWPTITQFWSEKIKDIKASILQVNM